MCVACAILYFWYNGLVLWPTSYLLYHTKDMKHWLSGVNGERYPNILQKIRYSTLNMLTYSSLQSMSCASWQFHASCCYSFFLKRWIFLTTTASDWTPHAHAFSPGCQWIHVRRLTGFVGQTPMGKKWCKLAIVVKLIVQHSRFS